VVNVKTIVVGKTLPAARDLADKLGVLNGSFVTSPRSIKAGGARGCARVELVLIDEAGLTDVLKDALAPTLMATGGEMCSVSRIL